MGAEGETGVTKVVNILRREVWSSRKVQLPFRADAATGY